MFIVYALPRSRTAWLSRFLTHGGVRCFHETAVFMRSIEDLQDFLSWPAVGTVETGIAQGHWLVEHYAPQAKIAVIRRPVKDVVASVLEMKEFEYDIPQLWRNMNYGDRCLRDIAAIPGVLSLDFQDLATESGCRRIFEHCHGTSFDREHWLSLKDVNIQVNVQEHLEYYLAHREEIDTFKSICKRELRSIARSLH